MSELDKLEMVTTVIGIISLIGLLLIGLLIYMEIVII